MNYFSIKTYDQKSVIDLLKGRKKMCFDTLSGHKDKVKIGDIVFIIISGDIANKEIFYENGLRAIGKIVSLPIIDDKRKSHFSLNVEIIQLLNKSITKDDFYYYPSLKNVANIGPDTKGTANQAFRIITNQDGKDVIRALNDISDSKLSSKFFDSLVENDYKIGKLQLSNSSKTPKKSMDNKINLFIQEKFIEWFEKPENYKKSYDGLVNLKVLNFWNENYFKNFLFSIDCDHPESSILKIEKLITDKSNMDWKKYSEASSKGAPEAVLGKKNYLSFLSEFIKDDENIKNLRNLSSSQNVHLLNQLPFNYKSFHKKTEEAGLLFSEKMVARFIASLCTKPFVICSGLSGSGKTKLAQAFVQWICESEEQYKIIPVGADWTNREPLLGYPDGLNNKKYVKPDSGALDVIFKALENGNKPYFLILDEMNLSHVERYFADFLSIMESKDKIKLHSGDTERGIAKDFEWPKNLFIIGTVNIDETTYMFSPKVLDRANVIEFRISVDDLKEYLNSNKVLDMDKFLNEDKTFGLGSEMSESFLKLAKEDAKQTIDNKSILLNFFIELQKAGAEFGYRSTFEINRIIAILTEISKDDKTWDGKSINENEFIDIAIMQKLLPKLHGSRNKLTRVLPILGGFCINETKKEKIKEIYLDKVDEIDFKADDNIIYKLSFEKICRMYKNAIENGYASYAEA